jgi:2-phospho-L-lactate guanylyltransferase
MQATAIVPVKRFDAAKSRLAGTSAAGLRPTLAEAMLSDVLTELTRAELIDRIVVVSGEPIAARLALEAGADRIDDRDDVGHSQAAMAGVEYAIGNGAGCVAMLPGDCPVMRADEIDEALEAMRPGVAVIPDRHGSGTNGLLLSPPDAIAPAFGPGSRNRHLEMARSAGVEGRVVEIQSMALDLDTGDDLQALTSLLQSNPDLAPATAFALASMAEMDS